MKTKNDLKTGILIGLGMIVVPLIIMSSKPITSPHTVTPESHVWEVKMSPTGGLSSTNILYNKKTGEIFTISYDGFKKRIPELKK